MSMDFHSTAVEPAGQQEVGAYRERLVTVLAASLALLIVAAIAVLMGMG